MEVVLKKIIQLDGFSGGRTFCCQHAERFLVTSAFALPSVKISGSVFIPQITKNCVRFEPVLVHFEKPFVVRRSECLVFLSSEELLRNCKFPGHNGLVI